MPSREPQELALFAAASMIPKTDKDDRDYQALTVEIHKNGILYPVLCVEVEIDGRTSLQIVDGAKRWAIAKQLGLKQIEYTVIPRELAVHTVLSANLLRDHLTKGQRAYKFYPLFAPAHEELKRLRLLKLRKGQQIPVADSIGNGETVADFAARLGVSRDVFEQAAALHKHFQNPKKFEWNDGPPATLKEYYQPRIMRDDDPVGLGAALAGIGAKLSGNVTDQSSRDGLALFTAWCDAAKVRFGYWENFTAADAKEARAALDGLAAAMPHIAREAMVDAIHKANKGGKP